MNPNQPVITACDRSKCDPLKALATQNLELKALMVLTRDAIIAKCGRKRAAAIANLVDTGIHKGLLKAIVDSEIEAQTQPSNLVTLTDATGRAK